DEDEDEPEIMELYRVPRGAERRAPRARAYERALPAPSSPYSLDPSFSRVPPMPDGVAPRHGDTRPVSA
ncbi:MAG: hypothetical protein KGH75_00815, partial [Rhodospirillales bacterium]|nr:hypothetical protein [Rhodospirillales bacterium]